MILLKGGVKMGREEEFLDQYKKLEEALYIKYGFDEKTFGSPIVRFINDKESKNYHDKLNICREIRNFLSHHSDFGGEAIIEPSSSIIEFLKEVTDYIQKPPLAVQYCTIYDNIMKTTPSQKAQTVMKKMQRQGFSHVPVIFEGELAGVFSISTFFSYALKYGMTVINDELLIGDFEEFLPPDKHENEKFVFLPPTATLFDVRAEFEKKPFRSKRLAVIFITDNGSVSGRIIGILTPWDVINT